MGGWKAEFTSSRILKIMASEDNLNGKENEPRCLLGRKRKQSAGYYIKAEINKYSPKAYYLLNPREMGEKNKN